MGSFLGGCADVLLHEEAVAAECLLGVEKDTVCVAVLKGEAHSQIYLSLQHSVWNGVRFPRIIFFVLLID